MRDDPQLVTERDRKLADLGPRPPWWRCLARRRWDAARRAVLAMDVSRQTRMLRGLYDDDRLRALAAAQNPFLTVAKAPRRSGRRFVQVVVTQVQIDRVERDPELLRRLEADNDIALSSLHRAIRSKL